jgi:predicted nucleic acid-binding protein
MNVLVDVSVLMPMIINRSTTERVFKATKFCRLQTPPVLPYEIGNALSGLKKRNLLNEQEVTDAYKDFIGLPLTYQKVDIEKALIIASQYLIYAYDAYYLEVATRKNLPLLTLDESMKRVALDLKLEVLEI